MVATTDISTAVCDFLKTNALAATLRTLVQGGATNILESGDVTESVLAAAVVARRTANTLSKVLAVSVQDAGERPDKQIPRHFFQFVVLRVLDRGRGYRNVREVRNELMRIMTITPFHANVLSTVDKGILTVDYDDRSGHQWDSTFAVDYEAISYSFRIVKREV